jgi:ferritin-like metal-binding protein YciE
MQMNNLQDLLNHELDDLYSAEQQITKALPKLAQAAQSPELRTAFETHLRQTEDHVKRLDEVFAAVGLRRNHHKCEAMEGLLKEGEEMIASDIDHAILDAALISAAQRVEHYEMAGYGCARTYARLLGHEDAAEMLQRTLDEEGAADRKLTWIAEGGINVGALGSDGDANGVAETTRMNR